MAKLSEWRLGRRDLAKYLAALPFVLSPDLGVAQLQANGYLRTNWSKAPWAYGSYSYHDLPRWLSDVETQISAGTERENINSWAYLLQDDYGGAEVVFPGGYAELFDAFSGGYRVYLNHEIHELDYRDQQVVLRWDGGDAAFDAVVVTLPLGVLKSKSVRFLPALPEDKVAALEKLGMGLLDKLYLRFDHVFWDREAVWLTTPETGLRPGQFNAWLNLHALFGEPILVAFNGGEAARDLAELSDETLLSHALSVLDKAYPNA